MCLELQENWEKETEEFRNSSNILIGYKILKKIDNKYFSLFQRTEYPIRHEIISDRESKILTEDESEDLEINKGIHFYRNIENSYNCDKSKTGICPCTYLCRYSRPCRHLHYWAKFEILPEDLVVVGKFDGFESFVTMKAKLIEIIGE